jgi:hypothetical protein
MPVRRRKGEATWVYVRRVRKEHPEAVKVMQTLFRCPTKDRFNCEKVFSGSMKDILDYIESEGLEEIGDTEQFRKGNYIYFIEGDTD